MYPVSNALLTAVKKNTRKYYWTGQITTTDGAVYDFTQEDIVKGSGYFIIRTAIRKAGMAQRYRHKGIRI